MIDTLQFEETVTLKREAVPVCLPPWLENPYRLVSLLDMFTFDSGRLVRAMQFLAETHRLLERKEYQGQPFALIAEREFFLRQLPDLLSYCDEAPFPMTKIPLERIQRLGDDRQCTADLIADIFGEAARRLRDEAGIHRLIRLLPERVGYYEQTEPIFGPSVADAFPSASFDIAESGKCFALNRNTACVFHLMRVLEIGLSILAAKFGVPSGHTNWHNIIEGIEKAVRNMGADPNRPTDWKDQQEFFAQAASGFMFIKDAWRNYTAHARGKYTEDEAETMLINVRAFMQKLATRLHE
jgi:hypothetical protein